MTKQAIIARLLALPAEIAVAEESVIAADQGVREAKSILQEREDGLLTSGAIDGKNETVRAAQIRTYTGSDREGVTQAEYDLIRVRNHLNMLRNEFSAVQAVAGLLREAV